MKKWLNEIILTNIV